MRENPPLRELNKKLIAAFIAYQTATAASPAFADDASTAALKESLKGNVSYSKFLDGVKEHIIERVRVEPNGRTADFITADGGRGQVELFNDPEFLNQIQKNGIDLYVMNAPNTSQ